MTAVCVVIGSTMAKTEVGILDSLDQILEALDSVGLSFSVIKPDGTTHGWMTMVRNTNPDGSTSLWSGLTQDGNQFKFDVSESQAFDVYDGEHLLLRLDTEKEVKAFLLGNLVGFTGLDVRETKAAVRKLAEDDPYRRSVELHKSGWCPIWNDWQHYFTERR